VMLQKANGRLKELPDVEGRAVYGLTGEALAAFGQEAELREAERCHLARAGATDR
jgi:hypothetical protein